MTKAAVKVVAKAVGLWVGKDGCAAKHKTFKHFSSVALQHCHARALAMTGTAFGVAFVQTPQTKSAQHSASTLCHAEGWQARVGMCAGRAVGWALCVWFIPMGGTCSLLPSSLPFHFVDTLLLN